MLSLTLMYFLRLKYFNAKIKLFSSIFDGFEMGKGLMNAYFNKNKEKQPNITSNRDIFKQLEIGCKILDHIRNSKIITFWLFSLFFDKKVRLKRKIVCISPEPFSLAFFVTRKLQAFIKLLSVKKATFTANFVIFIIFIFSLFTFQSC